MSRRLAATSESASRQNVQPKWRRKITRTGSSWHNCESDRPSCVIAFVRLSCSVMVLCLQSRLKPGHVFFCRHRCSISLRPRPSSSVCAMQRDDCRRRRFWLEGVAFSCVKQPPPVSLRRKTLRARVAKASCESAGSARSRAGPKAAGEPVAARSARARADSRDPPAFEWQRTR